jgi:hypothetical protein
VKFRRRNPMANNLIKRMPLRELPALGDILVTE